MTTPNAPQTPSLETLLAELRVAEKDHAFLSDMWEKRKALGNVPEELRTTIESQLAELSRHIEVMRNLICPATK